MNLLHPNICHKQTKFVVPALAGRINGLILPAKAGTTILRRTFSRRHSLAWLTLPFILVFSGCNKRDLDRERQAAVTETLTRVQSCLRQRTETSEAELAIVEITRQPQEISVRLVAYAKDKPVDFYLPVYLMSRGRWLINERERAFLLDEYCREFRLRDRKSVNGKPLPLDGKVVLPPNAAFEFKLSFARLPDETKLGALIYGARVIPFTLLPTPASMEKSESNVREASPAPVSPTPASASPTP